MAQMKEIVATVESRPKTDVIENAAYNIKARLLPSAQSNATNFRSSRIPNQSAVFI
jgi:hypothetical protein